MVEIGEAFRKLTGGSVLVIGDLMLDTYTIGKASRISPEAPVPVLHVQKEESLPGGAGNVALNLISMGVKTAIMGRIGSDLAGQELKKGLECEGVVTSGLIEQPDYQTPVKNRVIADNQQIVRVDREEVVPLPELIEQKLDEHLLTLLEGFDVIAISDYGKGFLTPTFLQKVISSAKKKNIPVIVDPKGKDFARYQGATLIKPNEGEAYAAAHAEKSAPIEEISKTLLKQVQCEALMITRSQKGISLFYPQKAPNHFPVKAREVKDVTGAGDTVLAVVACALADQLSFEEATQLGNLAAGLAIEKIGCARITRTDLAKRVLSFCCPKRAHPELLKQALEGKQCVLVDLPVENGLTEEMLKRIKTYKVKNDVDLVVHIPDAEPDDLFVKLLASIDDVDFVLVNQKDPAHLLKPLEVLHV